MKRRRGIVKFQHKVAGMIEETETGGFRFSYSAAYLRQPEAHAISLTLPLRLEPFESPVLFSFFEGLLAEGSLRDLQCRQHKIDPLDPFGLLLHTAQQDVIGCVTVERQDDTK